MPEITAVQYMTENLREWLKSDPIVGITIHSSANSKRIHLSSMNVPTGNPKEIFRRGKNSIIVYEKGFLVLQYQLSGKVLIGEKHTPPAFARLHFSLQSGRLLYWADKINFGHLHWCAQQKEVDTLLKTIGPEFWPEDRDPTWWKTQLVGKRPIHKILIDQKIVAGIGNIIAIETLHRSKIHPTTPPKRLQATDWEALATNIRVVVETSHHEHNQRRIAEKKSGLFRGHLPLVSEGHRKATGYRIYGRDGMLCPQCNTATISKESLGGRPIYLCTQCQPIAKK